MKTAYALLFLIFSAAAVASDGLSADKPAKGDWDFQAKKVWERERAGDEPFGRPGELRVSGDDRIYFHDFDKQVSYIFNREGGFVRLFARQGKAAGEVSRYVNCFTVGDKVVVGTPNTLEFFGRQGEFVKSAANDLFSRFPLVFINEDEFLTVAGGPQETRGGTERIVRRHVATGEETDFTEFPVSSKESGHAGGAIVLGLTPEVKVAYDQQAGAFYCGRNDEYAIHVVDLSGHLLRTFGLKRAKVTVTDKAKMEHLERFGLPRQRMDAVVRSLPNELAYYYRVQVNDGLVYVFAVATLDRHQNSQQVDVFGPDGTYLYRGRIECEAGKYVYGSPDNLQVRSDQLYVILEDGAGKKTLAKYQLVLPKQ